MAPTGETDAESEPRLEPVALDYVLVPLPPGRVAFHRWRWELWHGPRLLAAGWRLNVVQAQRALRLRALRYAHRVHGLHPLRLEAAVDRVPLRPGGPTAIDWGELRVVLTPRDRPALPRLATG
jgi:hypothetical protein